MKALVWYGTRDVRLEDVAGPQPGEGEAVLDVTLAGICGSDLHGYRGHPGPRVPPLILGHEVAGTVDGEPFTVYPLIGCGTCERCQAGEENLCPSWKLIGMHLPGVFSEQVLVPRSCLVPLPAGLDPRRAVLAEPLACCVGALTPEGDIDGEDVVIFGAGPIGLLSTFVAARSGARVTVVDPVPARLENARSLGAASGITSAEELPAGSADLIVDAAGVEATWRAGVQAVRAGGTIVMLGLGNAEGTYPMAVLVRRAIHLRGQFAYSRKDFARAVEILAEGDLDLGWLSDSPLFEGAQAFADLADRPAEFTKILLDPKG